MSVLSAAPSPCQSLCGVLSNECLQGDYWRMRLEAPDLCAHALPGQFVHLQVPQLEGHLLRRPFSICDVSDDRRILTLVYKVVGAGTSAMPAIRPGAQLDLLGPLGHGFSAVPAGRSSFFLGGGYGCAAMLFAAHRAARTTNAPLPVILLGARSQADILLADEFAKLGCEVRISTDDGSMGTKGRITLLLQEVLASAPNAFIAACGPRPMLKAVASMAAEQPSAICEVSLDERMCCGVGACFGCVVKVKAPETPEGWQYLRSCKEGPVFPAESILW